nr:hypothetical protein [Kibdelosporangium sp. MJ126-NF4]CEL22163.1 hypothetical protein [Kibdelosporangium sp. MJ126-NF4]CTQ92944.1 hypothetical protein [Kibdelosporangium sp. MJ126-NF4]
MGTSAYLRSRAGVQESASTPSPTPPAAPVTCRKDPCKVVAAKSLGDTRIELVVDADSSGARLKIGADRVIESRLPAQNAVLGEKSLSCVPGNLSACLIKGSVPRDGAWISEVVVSRSNKWNATTPVYLSSTEYQSLVNVTGDGAPELVTVQRAGSSFYLQVFSIDGSDPGCTQPVPKLERLPGWPDVKPDQHLLKPCSA